MSIGDLFILGGGAGITVFVPTALLSDVAIATIGGVITALITTGGGVLIALINRPPRQSTRKRLGRDRTAPTPEEISDDDS